ncbi:hypothetical protein F7734_08690 [Scytonema sp. UIC 10036]|uniref:hypothetical protein n=1 Tax=Scytonema sp. UIC 10036 TaxID=2304196 RepID=UPI0012DAD923|nr:hypothetical protein [Scytonema sp. UIC 10036]MUG92532.1 hypothetical protein [Scytonema sp. UIC 10036]
MATKIVSFRMDDSELAALEALKLPEDGSIHATAARLLKELLVHSGAMPNPAVEEVSTLIDQKVNQKLAEFRTEIQAQFEAIERKLKAS